MINIFFGQKYIFKNNLVILRACDYLIIHLILGQKWYVFQKIICNIKLGKNDISVNGTYAVNESCVLVGGEEAMEEDGVPGEEQSEEIKKKKRVGTLREGGNGWPPMSCIIILCLWVEREGLPPFSYTIIKNPKLLKWVEIYMLYT